MKRPEKVVGSGTSRLVAIGRQGLSTVANAAFSFKIMTTCKSPNFETNDLVLLHR